MLNMESMNSTQASSINSPRSSESEGEESEEHLLQRYQQCLYGDRGDKPDDCGKFIIPVVNFGSESEQGFIVCAEIAVAAIAAAF